MKERRKGVIKMVANLLEMSAIFANENYIGMDFTEARFKNNPC
jgi:hypothetical protein